MFTLTRVGTIIGTCFIDFDKTYVLIKLTSSASTIIMNEFYLLSISESNNIIH